MKALVIGCGGTGKWTLTQINETLEIADQSHIKLLSFDVCEVGTESLKGTMGVGLTSAGGDNDETIEISADVKRVFNDIEKMSPDEKNAHPAYRYFSWIDSEDARRHEFTETGASASMGASTERERGRTCFFLNSSEVQNRLVDALQDLQGQGSNKVPVFLVSSLAGGCGSSMIVDMAASIHKAASSSIGSGNLALFGVFVLPQAFEGVKEIRSNEVLKEKLRSNGYAAFRELRRAIVDGNFAVNYTDRTNVDLNGVHMFDACYLIDGFQAENKNLRSVPVEYGVAPAIADFIYTLCSNRQYFENNAND